MNLRSTKTATREREMLTRGQGGIPDTFLEIIISGSVTPHLHKVGFSKKPNTYSIECKIDNPTIQWPGMPFLNNRER